MGARQSNPATASDAVRDWWPCVFLFLFVFALNVFTIADADTWWHLKTGELIWTQRMIPRVDLFSYAIAGKPVVAFEWLSEVIFYLLYRAAGPVGLTGFKALLIASSFAVLWSLNRRAPLLSMLTLALAALGMRHLFVERPFIFDFLVLALLVRRCWDLDFAAPARAELLVWPAITAMWANLHGGAAVMAPALAASAAGAQWLKDRRVPWRTWVAVAALSAAAVFANPYGWRILEPLRQTLAFYGRDRVLEWRAPGAWFHDMHLYVLFLALGAWGVWKAGARKPFLAAWTVLWCAFSLKAVRYIPFYDLCAAPLFVLAAASLTEKAFIGKRWHLSGAGALAAAALCALAWWHTEYQVGLGRRFGFGAEDPLRGAVAFLDANAVAGRMFNEYDTGGYLIWSGYPKRPVFVDGRAVEYGPELVNQAMSFAQPGVWSVLQKRWDFDYAVLRRLPNDYSAKVLDERADWRLVHWDDHALVYLRDTPANAALIRRFGYALLKPGSPDYRYLGPLLRDSKRLPLLLAELDRSVAEAPDSVNALLLKANALMALRRWPQALALAEQGVLRFPWKAQPRFTLGWLRAAGGDLPRAESDYRTALGLIRGRQERGLAADIWNDLGTIHEKTGRLSEALSDYEKAASLDPLQPDARRNRDRLSLR